MPSSNAARTTGNLSVKAYEHIRRAVFSGELSPGTRLVNRKLAESLGTSFIPVREAINRLVSEGVVEQVPGAGAFVRSFDRQEVSEIYDVRELVEPFAAAEAARLINDHELDELKALLSEWEALGKTIAVREQGAISDDLDRWLTLNQRFHEIMIAASRNRFLAKTVNDAQVLSRCFAAQRGMPSLLSRALIRSTLKTHRALLTALAGRDSSAAQKVVLEQLRVGRKSVLGFHDQNKPR